MNTALKKNAPRAGTCGGGGKGSGAAAVYVLIIQQAAPFALMEGGEND